MRSQRLVLITWCWRVVILRTCKSVNAMATAYFSKLVDRFINITSVKLIGAHDTRYSYASI